MAWEEPRKTGMVYRRLGNSGLHVSALGLGGWLTFGGQVEDGMSLRPIGEVSVISRSLTAAADTTLSCMKQAYDCGINFFDTAEKYDHEQAVDRLGSSIG